MSNANLEMATWALHAKDQEARVDELEDLIADIKSTIESPFYTEEFKLKTIYKAIMETGY